MNYYLTEVEELHSGWYSLCLKLSIFVKKLTLTGESKNLSILRVVRADRP